VSADYFDQDAIWSLESLQSRPWMKQNALVTDPSGQDTYLRRDYVKPSNTSVGGVINSSNALLDKLEFIRTWQHRHHAEAQLLGCRPLERRMQPLCGPAAGPDLGH
jgi:hypothetical protein